MATSPLPILLGVGALLLLKGKGKGTPAATTTTTTETDVGGGAADGSGTGGTGSSGSTSSGSSGYKNVSIAKMKVIQQQLLALGYDPGTIDGKWKSGGNTYDAVWAFQKDNGLSKDGKPGPNTQAKLDELSGTSSGADTGGTSTDPGTGGTSGDEPLTQADLLFVPQPGPTQVAFNIAGTEYKLGSNFMNNYMEQRLNGARQGGWLATKSNDAPMYEDSGFEQSADSWMQSAMAAITGAGLTGGGVYGGLYVAAILVLHTPVSIAVSVAAGGAIAASAAVLAAKAVATWAGWNKEKWVKETGAYFVKKYVDQAHVIVGPNKTYTSLKSLPRTAATADFVADVAEKTAYFQSSTYSN